MKTGWYNRRVLAVGLMLLANVDWAKGNGSDAGEPLEAKPNAQKAANRKAPANRKAKAVKKPADPLYFSALPIRESLELAIRDLMATHGSDYPQGAAFLKRLQQADSEQELKALQREAPTWGVEIGSAGRLHCIQRFDIQWPE